MARMPQCSPDSFLMAKGYANPAYHAGDLARCVYCGRLFHVTAELLAADGRLVVPVHRYPTKTEIKCWKREGLYVRLQHDRISQK